MVHTLLVKKWHIENGASGPGGSGAEKASRKVGTAQGTALGNTQSGRPEESATEIRPPDSWFPGARARVKRWGKSPPAARVTEPARQAPPAARPSRKGQRVARPTVYKTTFPGRLQEVSGNRHPREIVAAAKRRVPYFWEHSLRIQNPAYRSTRSPFFVR